MNPTQLLAHFERISGAPDAILRLRRFVLDLAVRGKLVPQDSNDEPAAELLKRIAKEKARLVKVGEIKSPKPIPALSEIPFGIPSNWQWSQIAEIGVLSPRNEAPDATEASFVPMPLIPAEYGIAHKHEVRLWGEIKKGYTHFAEGDVGLAKITPCFENGKSTVFRNLLGMFGSGTTELHIVRPIFVDPDYILLFLKSPHFIDTGIPRMTGTAGQKRVPTEYFAHSAFPLPPLAEQRRIVVRVDQLMALCDQLEAAREVLESRRNRLASASLSRLDAPDPDTFQDDVRFMLDVVPSLTTRPDQVKQLRQTILNLAMRGRLVPQNPEDEPASELLRRIAAERSDLVKHRLIRREEPLNPIQTLEAPFEIPDGWVWCRVGDAFLYTQYGTSQKSYASAKGVPVLAMGNIQGGAVVWGDEKKIPPTSEELPALFLQKFDVLYNRTNSAELVGKTGIYLGEDGVRTFASYLIRLRPSIKWTAPRFLNMAMNTSGFRETQIIPLIKKQTGQANVNGTALKNMLLPLPPLAEQKRIVDRVDELVRLCDRLEVSLNIGQQHRSSLLISLLGEALNPAEERDKAA